MATHMLEGGADLRVSEDGPTSDTYSVVLESSPSADVTVTTTAAAR